MSEGPHPVIPDRAPDEVSRDGVSRTGRPPMPRWVKVLLVMVLVLGGALLISKVLGLEHGPGMHGAMANGAVASGAMVNAAVVNVALMNEMTVAGSTPSSRIL